MKGPGRCESRQSTFSNRWQLPAFDNPSAVIPFPWPCPTEGWQPRTDQSSLSWDSKASVHTSERREREEEREAVESSSVWAVIFTLIFSFEKSSTLQGCSYSEVFSVCVVWKLFFSPAYLCYLRAIWEIRILRFWRLLCIMYLRKVFLLSWKSVFAELNQASQRDLTLRSNSDTWQRHAPRYINGTPVRDVGFISEYAPHAPGAKYHVSTVAP